MVIEASNYSGPNILKLPGCDSYVPIAPVSSQATSKSKSKRSLTRISLPLEGGDAATGFKGQGANFALAEVDLDGWFQVAGIFLVAISRVRSPTHLYMRTFPNYMDIQLQRLKENVLDAQAFEEAVRVRSEWSYRHQGNCSEEFWNAETNRVADIIIDSALSNGLRVQKDKALVEKVQMKCTSETSPDTIMAVIQKLMDSRECMVAEKAPHLKPEDYNTLQNYHNKRSVKTKNVPEETQQLRSTKRKANTRSFQPQETAPPTLLAPKESLLALKAAPNIANGETFKGLQNSGHNVCFINAAVIALCHTTSLDSLLRQFHVVHQGCTGILFATYDPCPLCALYEVINRAYRHHHLRYNEDVPKMPIIKLTESLIPGWSVGVEHDADEFLTKLLERLDTTIGCGIHKGIVRTTRTCQHCRTPRITQDAGPTPLRIAIHLAEYITDEISIQEGINKWLAMETKVLTCDNCALTPHDLNREIVISPDLMIINIHRHAAKKTLIDHEIITPNQVYIFKSAINFHPRHYTTVGSPGQDHYVYYSDEDVQTCHGNLVGSAQNMNRVRTPLQEHATVLLYERV